MSNEKFEVLFMGGGALIDVLGNRVRRKATTPREAAGTAMHALTVCFDEHRDELADPQPAALALYQVREGLCAAQPDARAVLEHVEAFVILVGPLSPMADSARKLDDAIAGWLG
jgi:hypothetical protein